MVWINDHSFSHGACQCSWGGVKDSGLGRSHSKFGFYECVNIKLVAWEPGLTRDFWWHPYDRDPRRGDPRLGALLYGKGGAHEGAARGWRPAAAGRRPDPAQGPLGGRGGASRGPRVADDWNGSPGERGYLWEDPPMTIAVIVVVCIVLAILAFLVPRTHGPQKGVDMTSSADAGRRRRRSSAACS